MAAADVEMPVAESSSLATLSRRQHLGQTFEAYQAELDDEVRSLHLPLLYRCFDVLTDLPL